MKGKELTIIKEKTNKAKTILEIAKELILGAAVLGMVAGVGGMIYVFFLIVRG